MSDLKPRGAKAQWWLVPLDALALALARSADAAPREVILGDSPDTRYTLTIPGHAPIEYTVQDLRVSDPDGPLARIVHRLAAYQAHPGVDTAADMAAALLPLNLESVVRVFEHGARKYAPDNWRGAAEDLPAFRREYLSAICRHLFAGETTDPESGLPHQAHAATGALMILWHEMEAER